MDPVLAIFERLGGPARVAERIGVTVEHAATMRRRKSIPVRYWAQICATGAAREICDVSYADLVAAHASRPLRASRQPEAMQA